MEETASSAAAAKERHFLHKDKVLALPQWACYPGILNTVSPLSPHALCLVSDMCTLRPPRPLPQPPFPPRAAISNHPHIHRPARGLALYIELSTRLGVLRIGSC